MDNLKPKENQGQTESEKGLAGFQEEMAQFQEDERMGVRKSGHFLHTPGFNPKELTEEDMAIWQKIKDKSIGKEDVDVYRKNLVSVFGNLDSSRGQFCQMAANLGAVILMKKQLEEYVKNKQEAKQ